MAGAFFRKPSCEIKMIAKLFKQKYIHSTLLVLASINCYAGDYAELINACDKQVVNNQELCNGSSSSSLEVRNISLIPASTIKKIIDRCSSHEREISILLTKQKINELYACIGYINSGVLIKKNSSGNYYLDAIEGTISRENIEISDVDNKRKKYILHALMDNKASKKLNINDIRGRLELLKKSELFKTINTTITPLPGVLGQAKIHLSTKRKIPYKWTISLDNQQPESTGKNQLSYVGSKQSIFTLFDSIGGSISISEGSKGLGFFYTASTTQKSSWDISLERKESKIIAEPLDKLDITSELMKFSLGYNQKLYNTLITHNQTNDSKILDWKSNLELVRSQNYLLDRAFSFSSGEDEGESAITSIQSTLAWEKKHRGTSTNHVFSASAGVDFGIEALGASEKTANSSGSQHKIIKASLGYKQSIAEHGSLLISMNGQFTNDKLLAAKRVGLGGVGSVRGVDKNITSTDSSIALSTESTILLPKLSGTPFAVGSAIDGNVYANFFADYAFGKDNQTNDEFSLGSVGAGLTWHPTKNSRFNVSWGKPVIFNGFTESQINKIDDGKLDISLTIGGSK